MIDSKTASAPPSMPQAQTQRPPGGRTAAAAVLRALAWRLGWRVGVAALLAACAASPKDPAAAAQATVRARAQQYADAIVRQDAAAAYALTSPAYRRLVPLEVYAQRRAAVPTQWLDAQILQVDCPPNGVEPPLRCIVRLDVTSQVRLPLSRQARAPIRSVVQDTWVRDGDQWWVLEEL